MYNSTLSAIKSTLIIIIISFFFSFMPTTLTPDQLRSQYRALSRLGCINTLRHEQEKAEPDLTKIDILHSVIDEKTQALKSIVTD